MGRKKQAPPILGTPEEAHRQLFAAGIIGDWLLDEGQLEIRALINGLPEDVRKPILLISRQWGKTYLAVCMAIEYALRNPKTLQLYISPSIKQAANLVVPKFREMLQWAPEGLVKPVKSEYTWEFANGSIIRLGGMDTATESFRGLSVHQIWADEVGSCSPEGLATYVIQSVLIPTLTRTLGRLVMISTPSRHLAHPFHTKYIPEARVDGCLYKKTIHDLPDSLCRGGITKAKVITFAVKESGGTETAAFKREYLCEITRDESIIVVPEFNQSHIGEAIPPEYRHTWLAGDYGGSRDKSVFLRCYWDFMRAKMIVEDELVFESGTSNGVIAPALKGLLRGEAIPFWVDMPGQVKVDLRKDYSLNVTTPTKIEADAALNALRVAFSRGQIEVNPRCKFLIASLEGGAWNDKRTDYLRTDALGHCDAIDALIYAWRHRNEKNPYPNVYNPNVWTGGGKPQTDNQDLLMLARALKPAGRKHG